MQFTVERRKLLNELKQAQAVMESRATIPILANVKLEAKGDALTVTGTDLEVGIIATCPAEVKKDGATTVPGKKLFDYLRAISDEQVSFKAAAQMSISAGRSNVRMPLTNPESYPALPEMPSQALQLSPGMIADMIRRTAFAISKEESRYTLNAALLSISSAETLMVATDGHRLAYVTAPTGEGTKAPDSPLILAGQGLSVLVPRKALGRLSALISELPSAGALWFAQDEGHLFFRLENRLLICRKITGQFPAYEAVLPKANGLAPVSVDRAQLLSAVHRVSLFADDRTHCLRLDLSPAGLKVSCSADNGDSDELVPVEYAGDGIALGFNAQYLSEFLAVEESAKILMSFKDGQSAAEFRPDGGTVKHRHVIMPMRI